MRVEIQVNSSLDPLARFVTWAPSPCRIRVTDSVGATPPSVNVTLTGKSAAGGGAIVFRAGTSGNFTSSLTLSVPVGGASVNFFTAGKFGQPSSSDGDVVIEARAGTTLVGSAPIMVRIRKNANTLTNGERDRFVAAFAQLNNQGLGRFTDFREMHTDEGDREAHGGPAFLPWHRAYLLDLERELQAIDPTVTLPYWRFDKAAPKLFTLDFIGVSDDNGSVQFSPSNPLQFWKTDNILGVDRTPDFDPTTQGAFVSSESATLGLGSIYRTFRNMQGDPHGFAHTSFSGSISSIGTAARDPLFFLLHCNVDRLWAKWQRLNKRFDHTQASSYDTRPSNEIGHRLGDTMWPWNGITGNPRPSTAPGGPLAASPCVVAPGPSPRVQDHLDYQGTIDAQSRLGFDYDDVAF